MQQFYPEEKGRNFLFITQILFANFEFIFAIRDPDMLVEIYRKYSKHGTK